MCVDNLESSTLENLEHLRDDAFVFVNHDMVEHLEVDEPVDVVYHLAALASPIDYLRQPLHSLKVGSYGTHHALGLAKFKRARFLLVSTSEVYGDPQVHPQPESYWGNVNPIGPRGVYDEAKRYAEALTMAYHNQQGVDTAIVRIFNTYGPRMRSYDGRAIPTFMRQALENAPITVFGARLTDTQLLLRGRPDPRPAATRRQRRAPAGQHRQPSGVFDSGARANTYPTHVVKERNRVRSTCQSTIHRFANPTSPEPGSCWAGSRKSSSKRGCGGMLPSLGREPLGV